MPFAPRLLAAVYALLIVLGGCASAPPPMPSQAGKIILSPGAVTWVPGLYTGGPVYGPCNRILSVDGGGIRGIIPAMILEELERETGKPIYSLFDLIAGTSTGAIIALGLTRPSDENAQIPRFRAADLVGFYSTNSTEIFPHSFEPLRKLRRYFLPKYGSEGIEAVLENYFGDVRLVEALTQVIIPAYDLEDRKRIWFDSYSRPAYHIFMKDVARGATAAPTYLPPARFPVPNILSPKGYVSLVDGGLFANNPALTALSRVENIGRGSTDFLLVSLGTGSRQVKLSFNETWNWGVIAWVDPLLDISFSDPAIEEEVRSIVELRGDEYYRLQVELDERDVTLDDSSSETIDQLRKATQTYIEKNRETLRILAYRLQLPRSPQCGIMRSGSDYERPMGPRKHSDKIDAGQ